MKSRFEGQKLLILGGAAVHTKVVEAARAMGIFTIVTDNITGSPAKLMADQSYDLNVSDVEGITAMAKAEGVSAVISVCLDFCQIYYQKICERLSLPCWGTEEQFRILTHKEAFKANARKAGVDVIPSYDASDFEGSFDGNSVEYPVLVKPSQNRGSRGQRVCHNAAEAREAIRTAREQSGDGLAIIEKHMGGKQDFQVCYLIVDGTPFVVRTADRYQGEVSRGLGRVCIALNSPSRHAPLYHAKVHARMAAFLHELGLTNAPAFFQGFIDGDRIRFYDPGLRFPGGDYEKVFKDIMGYDLITFLIEMAFTGRSETAQKHLTETTADLAGNYIAILHSTLRPGTIRKLTPPEVYLSIPGVVSATYRHGQGDTITASQDVNQRILETDIQGKSLADIRASILKVQAALEVLDEEGRSMVISPFDVDKL